ncbi:UNVERIFIED_CONTAM: hypothetical protein Sradi_2276700 [Sesamum radiatum]|uniref:Uncharacterized protein n=1 Tax=Sesamum radiatum TaxID=300843 RepID=A0AAW2T4H4_SESRA
MVELRQQVAKETMLAEPDISISEHIMMEELPAHFRAPSYLPAYYGTTDPAEYIRKFENAVLLHRMSSGSRAWLVAASIGAVEALKDQGFCRWNYALRLLQQHAKNNLRSYSTQGRKLCGPSSSMISNKMREEQLKQSEESLRKVMYLSCWGPN